MENETIHSPEYTAKVLDTAMLAGHIMLANGAEIFRVERTMSRIASAYGETGGDFFVLSNGIFCTGGESGGGSFAKVQHIPVRGARLQKVIEVNRLCHEVMEGKYTIDEVYERLVEIQEHTGKSNIAQILASGVGAAAFAVLLGGSASDAAAAFIAGLLLYTFVLFVSGPHMSKILGNLCGGIILTVVCLSCYKLGLGTGLNYMVAGSVVPLIPGVAFTNGIRDIAEGDYLSGMVRLLDAMLVFFSIAIGIGLCFMAYTSFLGGALL